ncbi:MAG: hypothetical protein WDW38_005815 [Sanguina aurantia]
MLHTSATRVATPNPGSAPAAHRCQGVWLPHSELTRWGSVKDKYMSMPISELVAGDTERVTASYVKMPVGYPPLSCCGRTSVGKQVLNDSFVNVITGSEDYSFKLMRKNQYEEALFRCEDDRYEFEMCIETNGAAMKRLRAISERLQGMGSEERSAYRLEDAALGRVHFRAIERLYADQGQNLLELMRKNPAVAVPIVLMRMEQKDAEWRKVRADMTTTWQKVYDANYHKSLDHRSFYFKQAEKKLLLPKTMVTEVRDAAERRRLQDSHLAHQLSHCHRLDPSAPPDLVYDYSQRKVFEDCFSVLRAASKQHLQSGGPRESVMGLYLELVEPLFGLKPRTAELARMKAEKQEAKRAAAQATEAKSDTIEPAGHEDENMDEAETRGRKPSATPNGTPEPTVAAAAAAMKAGRSATGDRSGASAAVPQSGEDEADDEGSADVVVKAEDEAGGDGMESSDENPGRSYESCRPLAPWTGKEHGPGPNGRRVLFANDHMYVFFRYHRFLFDRLWTARKCCDAKASAPTRHGESQAEPEDPQAQLEARELQASLLHTSFIDKLTCVINSTMEVSAFEDQCRSLLGTNSYELFTLDKLVHKLLKHMQLMLQDESTMTLWELYRSYINNPTSAHPETPLFLQRNIAAVINDPAAWTAHGKLHEGHVGGPSDEALLAALRQVAITNGLECKVGVMNTKVGAARAPVGAELAVTNGAVGCWGWGAGSLGLRVRPTVLASAPMCFPGAPKMDFKRT